GSVSRASTRSGTTATTSESGRGPTAAHAEAESGLTLAVRQSRTGSAARASERGRRVSTSRSVIATPHVRRRWDGGAGADGSTRRALEHRRRTDALVLRA